MQCTSTEGTTRREFGLTFWFFSALFWFGMILCGVLWLFSSVYVWVFGPYWPLVSTTSIYYAIYSTWLRIAKHFKQKLSHFHHTLLAYVFGSLSKSFLQDEKYILALESIHYAHIYKRARTDRESNTAAKRGKIGTRNERPNERRETHTRVSESLTQQRQILTIIYETISLWRFSFAFHFLLFIHCVI